MDLANSVIFELQRLFATSESLKSVRFLTHAVVQNLNSKHFHSNAYSFQIHYSYIRVAYCEKWSLKRKRSLLSQKYKAITKVESDKFSVLYERTLQSKKQKKKKDIYIFHVIKL